MLGVLVFSLKPAILMLKNFYRHDAGSLVAISILYGFFSGACS
jgi:hypothetical protein